jgi:hypothetical protein
MTRKNTKSPKRVVRTQLELLMDLKAKKFLSAEKEYWTAFTQLRKQRHTTASSLELPFEEKLPESISSTVWALNDGVAFVRYQTVGAKAKVEFRVHPTTLKQWGNEGLIVPIAGGEISLAQAGLIRGLGNVSIMNCNINGVNIPYAEFSHLRYGEIENAPSIEQAVLDFQLAIIGFQTQSAAAPASQAVTGAQTINILKKLADEFETLIAAGSKEEELQVFLKKNPFILHPSAELIPKKKLGEDFVTDFVLVATTTQGPVYILVELERASHSILTKDLVLSGPVNHAIKQTRDWDVWLEKNKAYIQNKLQGFETPTYMIVIGRSNTMTNEDKSYLRSYNREWKNTTLMTYDDLLTRFRNTIVNLESISEPEKS